MTDRKNDLDSTAPDTAIFVEGVDYDRRDAKAGMIALVSTSILAVLAVMIIGIYYLYVVWFQKVEFSQYTGVASKELQALHNREEEQLHRYSFIDKEKGTVRIPIERAMDLVESEYRASKVSYNTKTYAAKEELPGGAAGGANPPVPAAPAGPPAATGAPASKTPAAPAAGH